mmetsp:Transcript_38779/g.93316  ORF Transcript_38779/g.93316 Transcript_38779/m.93316 type:complete len:122 (+) Transcript_38779:387-752(+)
MPHQDASICTNTEVAFLEESQQNRQSWQVMQSSVVATVHAAISTSTIPALAIATAATISVHSISIAITPTHSTSVRLIMHHSPLWLIVVPSRLSHRQLSGARLSGLPTINQRTQQSSNASV